MTVINVVAMVAATRDSGDGAGGQDWFGGCGNTNYVISGRKVGVSNTSPWPGVAA